MSGQGLLQNVTISIKSGAHLYLKHALVKRSYTRFHPKHKEGCKCFWETWLLNLQLCLLLIIFEDLFLFIYVDMYVCTYVWEYLQRPEEALESPKARVTGGCEPSNMCAKTQIL